MIKRNAIEFLKKWKKSNGRKPLIIRGARQVGKTTIIKEFAKSYDVFLNLNLENEQDRAIFETDNNVHQVLRTIFFYKQKEIKNENVLLFIDEIQYSQRAVAILRYFYEEANYIHVIVAGSLLETIIDVRKISFPVGRVQFMALRPCCFLEFLSGIGEDFDTNLIRDRKVSVAIHNRIIKYFNEYTLVGGMPAAISNYAENRDILSVKEVYESLLISYQDDVEKYTANAGLVRIISTILTIGWSSAGKAITFENFGGTKLSSKEVSNAFRTVQKAMLLELAYPTSAEQMPLIPNYKKHPKLLWLDTGLVNYMSGIQKEVFSVTDIQDVWRGQIAEHIVAQELLTLDNSLLTKRIYWRRDKQGAEAEVDFLYNYNGLAIPIEVKSGHNSKLKALHIFMDNTPHKYAIRVWSQPFSVDKVHTFSGKEFSLINLPFYYVGVLDKVLEDVILIS
jgi:predicted AAA+ superfamily ATPase